MSIASVLIVLALLFLILAITGHVPLWVSVLCLVLERLLSMRALFVVAALVILPTTAHAQERPFLDRAINLANGAALVAHSADLATTVNCLAAKTCTEANPLLVPHVQSPVTFFALKMGVALGSYVVKTKTKRAHPKLTLAFAIAETVAFSLIAAHNAKVHREARR